MILIRPVVRGITQIVGNLYNPELTPDLVRLGLPRIYDDSCLMLLGRNWGGGGGSSADGFIEIASG